MKMCVYGGHYGSEGKGSVSEYLVHNARHVNRDGKVDRRLIAIGENSPNSGHTCSKGKTRNLPAASFFADEVILGPNSVIDQQVLISDLEEIKRITGRTPQVFIHGYAALIRLADFQHEQDSGLVGRISSTGSGSGSARAYHKHFLRDRMATLAQQNSILPDQCLILNRLDYLTKVRSIIEEDLIFECSQGVLLDIDWGIYPYCTSQHTLPRVAIERNGMGTIPWQYFGVYRTFPIRTGGPSGPTGGREIQFSDINQLQEIATVTKRIRRIFEFSKKDFELSMNLTRPNYICFTHTDYLKLKADDLALFLAWYGIPINYRVEGLFLSDAIGHLVNHGARTL